MIRKHVCFDAGHDWKDGFDLGEVVYAYRWEAKPPMAPGQYYRVGQLPSPWTVSTDHHRVEAMTVSDWWAVIPHVIHDARHLLRFMRHRARWKRWHRRNS